VAFGDQLAAKVETGLLITDGSLAGSFSVHQDLVFEMASLDDKMVFSASSPEAGIEPWVSDGTPEGTHLIRDIRPGSLDSMFRGDRSEFLIRLGDKVYFRAYNGKRMDFWESDGSAVGTKPFFRPLYESSEPSAITTGGMAKGLSYFTEDLVRPKLWVTDGTESGTRLIREMDSPSLGIPVELPDCMVFSNASRVWRTDGTAAGTYPITDATIEPFELQAGEGGEKAYVRGWQAVTRKIWEVDGSIGGTREIVSEANLPGAYLEALAVPAGEGPVFFRLAEFEWTRDYFEPWAWNSKTGRTEKILDIEGISGSRPLDFTAFNSRYWFTAKVFEGINFYSTNGTAGGTQLVKVIESGFVSPGFTEMVTAQSGIYFTVRGALWFSDGTSGGTVKLGPAGGAKRLTPLGDRCFYTIQTSENERKLMVAGRTPGSIVDLKTMSTDPAFFSIEMAVLGDLLYFNAEDEATGEELWVSDGTVAGTRLVRDENPGPPGALPKGLRSDGQGLFFFQNDGIHGNEPWVLDDFGQIFISSQPKAKMVMQGSSPALEMDAVGSEISYEWFAGRSGETTRSLGREKRLEIEGIEQSGFYWCRASNAGSSVDSREVYLKVVPPFQYWWQQTHPGAADETVDLLADPDFDGNSILSEFAFGGSPDRAEHLHPLTMDQSGQAPSQRLSATLRTRISDQLDFIIQESHDLIEWTEVENPEIIDLVNTGDGFARRSLQFDRNETTYFRVVVRWVE